MAWVTVKRLREIFRLCRVQHWIKNLLVLLPAFYGDRLLEPGMAVGLLLAIVSFSFVASAVYVLNDAFDAERDRRHAAKRERPLACGSVSVGTAAVIVAALLAAGFGCGCLGRFPAAALAVLGLYFAANVAYSAGLKDVALVDVFVLASGFVFRIFYGGLCFGIPISSWLFLCVFATALAFAFGKRRCEFARLGPDGRTRAVLAKYTENFLKAHYYACCALSIAFYSLWTVSRTGGTDAGKLALTIPFFVFILFRYDWIVESGKSDGDPVPLLLHDVWLLSLSAAFALLNFAILYAGKL